MTATPAVEGGQKCRACRKSAELLGTYGRVPGRKAA